MTKVDFDGIQDIGPLPGGVYLCSLDDVEISLTKGGHEMWKLAFRVQEGLHQGKYIHDNLPFTRKALPRVKALCTSLGVDVSGKKELTPEMIRGRKCRVTVRTESFDGRTRAKVPFDGFAPASGGTLDKDEGEV